MPRVSTYGQTLDAQLEQLRGAGCSNLVSLAIGAAVGAALGWARVFGALAVLISSASHEIADNPRPLMIRADTIL
jgi:hypothetical protein